MLRNKKILWTVITLLAMLASSAALADVSPTTGLETDRPYRPVMVEYSNSPEARPQWNMSEADVVYEAIYWGPEHTRYQVLFNDTLPDRAGSVRGARTYGLSLAVAWDCAFASHGGQDNQGTSIYDFAKQHNILEGLLCDGVKSPDQYFGRATGITDPHNVSFDVAGWVANEWPVYPATGEPYKPRASGMAFSETPSTGDAKVTIVDVFYGDIYNPVYHYDETEKLWMRQYDGEPQIDATTKRAIAVANVIVQANEEVYFQNAMSRPVINLVGEGPVLAFIDGTMVEGKWVRPSEKDPIRYELANGAPLLLRPGKTFVQIVPPDMFDNMTGQGGTITFTNPMAGMTPEA